MAAPVRGREGRVGGEEARVEGAWVEGVRDGSGGDGVVGAEGEDAEEGEEEDQRRAEVEDGAEEAVWGRGARGGGGDEGRFGVHLYYIGGKEGKGGCGRARWVEYQRSMEGGSGCEGLAVKRVR